MLLLEDDQGDSILLLRALERSGFDVTATIARDEGEYREGLSEELDLILADFTLGAFDALRALEIRAERGLEVPFIVVTGTVGEDVTVECMRRGAADYLLKDRLGRLGEAVSRALRDREVLEKQRHSQQELGVAREQARRDWNELLQRLARLAEHVGLARDSHSVYRALFDFCVEATPAESLAIASYDPDTRLRTCLYIAGLADGRYEESDPAELPQMPLHDSPQGRAIKSGQAVIIRDYLEEVVRKGVKPIDLGSDKGVNDVQSAIAVPMLVAGRVIGAFELQSVKRGAFDESHATALSMAANHAAIALENVGLLQREREQRQAAERSESRYRELIDQASDGIAVFDAEGVILKANKALTDMLGVSEEELLGSVVQSWRDEPTRGGLVYEKLVHGASMRVEQQFRRRDGIVIPVEMSIRRLEDGSVQSIVRDVSERKRAQQELLDEKIFSDSVINSLPGVFYLYDENLRFLRWNRNLSTVTGYSHADIEAMAPADFFADDQQAGLQQAITQVLGEGSTTVEAELLTKDGRRIPYFFSAMRLVQGGSRYVVGTGLDISQQKQAEARVTELNSELERRLALLSALHDIDRAITGSVDMGLTLAVVLDKVMSELKVDACGIWVYQKSSQELRRVVSKGLPKLIADEPTVRLGDGPLGRCGLQREMVSLGGEEMASIRAVAPGLDSRLEHFLAVPLISKGQLQGVLELLDGSAMELKGDWLEFLQALALQSAIAIDNVTLFEGLERSTEELTLAYDATIEGWARALDLRDHETEGHSRRVTELTVRLARHMGVPEVELAHMRRGALLHDIGKLGVPDAILMKPAELSDSERQSMERHAQLGYELLAPISFLKPAVDIPYAHHESWDGGGYPRGLRGEEIPLSARIFAVADVFDALTSDRPYRSAWTRGRALQYIVDRSGRQFDPEVVSAFVELVDDRLSAPIG